MQQSELTLTQQADLSFLRTLLKDYAIRTTKTGYYCTSTIGIDDSGKDVVWNEYYMPAFRRYFGKRWIEVNHTTCSDHLRFDLYVKLEAEVPKNISPVQHY